MDDSKTITQQALDRILTAVGNKSIPTDLDRDALIRCLELSARRYSDAVKFKSDKLEKIKNRRLGAIRKAAKRLEQLLGPVDIRRWVEPPGDTFTTTQLVHAVDLELLPFSS